MKSTVERLATLVYTIKEGEKLLTSVGHTLLQKMFYLLQYGQGVKLGYKYKLYYYGPYCQDLWSDLHLLDSEGIIKIEAYPSGFGYKINTINSEKLGELKKYVNHDVKEKVFKLLKILGGEPVKTLEALATTHYVYTDVLKRKGHIEDDMLIDKVCALKPHLSSNDIIQAKNILTANNLF